MRPGRTNYRRRHRRYPKKLIGALQWGNKYGKFQKQWQKTYDEGGDPPRQFFERPEIEPYQELYWYAFNDLTTERQSGMGVGPIPVSKIEAYAKKLGLSPDEADRFEIILRRMDEAYVTESMPTKPGEPKMRDEVSIDDTRGILGLFRRLGKQKQPPGKEVAK